MLVFPPLIPDQCICSSQRYMQCTERHSPTSIRRDVKNALSTLASRCKRLPFRIANSIRNFLEKTSRYSTPQTAIIMPSKLAKITKHVTKKKGAKITSLHEDSRDARRLRKAGARDDRVIRMTHVRQKANGQWLERIAFMQESIPETLHPLEEDEVRV